MDGGGSHRREPGPRRSAGIRMPERARMRGGRRGPEMAAEEQSDSMASHMEVHMKQ